MNSTDGLVPEVIEKLAHTHKFATEWTSDETNHWHASICGHAKEVSGKAAHTFGDWTTTKEATEEAEGSKERTCSVCGYKATEVIEKLPHTHKFENGKCECGELHDCIFNDGKCECGSTNTASYIEYFNKHLNNANYKTSNYTKNIEFGGIKLLEEKTTSSFDGANGTDGKDGTNGTDGIGISKSEINDLGELEEITKTEESTEPTEISIQLKEEYFSEINVNDKTLEGKVKDSSSASLLNIQAKSIEIKVSLNDQLKVSSITLKYIDTESNFNVSITVTYTY